MPFPRAWAVVTVPAVYLLTYTSFLYMRGSTQPLALNLNNNNNNKQQQQHPKNPVQQNPIMVPTACRTPNLHQKDVVYRPPQDSCSCQGGPGHKPLGSGGGANGNGGAVIGSSSGDHRTPHQRLMEEVNQRNQRFLEQANRQSYDVSSGRPPEVSSEIKQEQEEEEEEEQDQQQHQQQQQQPWLSPSNPKQRLSEGALRLLAKSGRISTAASSSSSNNNNNNSSASKAAQSPPRSCTQWTLTSERILCTKYKGQPRSLSFGDELEEEEESITSLVEDYYFL